MTEPSLETTAPPNTMSALSDAQAFVLRGFRHWVVGLQRQDSRHWSMVWNDYASAFGAEDARTALGALTSLVRALCGHARRAIVHHQPCCGGLSPDEVCLISLIADCQRDDDLAAERRAAWLVTREGAAELVAAAANLAQVLEAHGFRLATPTLGDEEASWGWDLWRGATALRYNA